MKTSRLLQISGAGALIAALCCFTPILVVLFGAVGLSALTGYIDVVLLPALAFFVCLTAYALWRRNRERTKEQKHV